MARSPSISVCNLALSEVRAPQIISLDDDQPEARACAINYDDCLQLLLEAHEWGFATVRTTLAAMDLNDRNGEWLYAYGLPEDIASKAALIYPWQTPISGVYFPWPYNFPRPPFMHSAFVIAGSAIYSNTQGAILQYVSRDVEEEMMPAAFKRALTLDLASRLAIALRDDRTMKGDLIQQAEAAKRRAMAEDLNRYPRRDEPFFDEVAQVRA
jgi:hypothetical protein